MDNNTLAIIKDQSDKIDKSFQKIENKINSYKKADKKNKKSIKNTIQNELNFIKEQYLPEMKKQIDDLKDEQNKENYEKIYNKLKLKIKNYKEKINNLDSEEINNEEKKDDDYLDPNAKVDLNQLNVEQAMKRGDNILEEDDKAISNMNKIVGGDVDTMKKVNIELNNQKEKMATIDKDLKEIEFSVDRARKKITNMFKIYASDKCVICLIVVILIIIVTIILVSAFGGDNKNNFNVPHDIFGTNNIKNSTTNNGLSIGSSFSLMKIIIIYVLFLFEI